MSTTMLPRVTLVLGSMAMLCGSATALTPTASTGASGLLYYTPAARHTVSFTERSLVIDDTRALMLSGAVHYTRVHEEEWERVFELAVEMGLNCIQTYVFWNAHETSMDQVGNASWEGRANLPRFIKLAADHGLWVDVRIGPYICGEYYFGGIPTWVRDTGAECFRCSDPIWKREMARWVGVVVDKIRPQLATAGGNVILLQVENEYSGGGGAGGSDQDYLDWCVDMGRNLTTDVPWILCHDIFPCTKVNTNNVTGEYDYKAICTINGFWMDEDKETFQPSPKWISDLQAGNPGQPWLWTEDQGWFDQWGVAKRVRDSRDQLYGIARFIAHGGSYHNFYMLTGGNNYGKLSGGDVVTAYAPDTVIDSLLLRHQPRFDYYARFFHAVANVSAELLASPTIPPFTPLTPGNASASSATASAGHCTDDDPSHVGTLDASQQWHPSSSIVPGATFALTNSLTGLCMDPLSGTTPPALKKCDSTQSLEWMYLAATKQFQSVATRACQAPASKGKQCHVCLDLSGATLDLWDCKSQDAANQEFVYDGKLSGLISGSGPTRQCVTAVSTSAGGAEVSVYGSVAFISNMDDASGAAVTYAGREYFLPNHTVAIIRPSTGEVVFNSSELVLSTANNAAVGQVDGTPGGRIVTPAVRVEEWVQFQEAPAAGTMSKTSDRGPIEQLHLTGGQAAVQGYFSDYLWYTTSIPTAPNGQYTVKSSGGGGTILYHYVNNVLLPAGESYTERPDSATDDSENVEVHVASGSAPSPTDGDGTTSTLQVLSVAMGLYNGGVGPKSIKGLTSSKVNNVDITNASWGHSWLSHAETKEVWSNPSAVVWSPIAAKGGNDNSSLTWFKSVFDLPTNTSADRASDGAPAQLSYALSLIGTNKGVAFVNGFELGRYWLEPGTCSGACAPPIKDGHCYMHWRDCGEPTQTLYHIPTPVLQPTGNVVVIYEETATVGPRDLSMVQLLEVQNHP